MKKDVFVIIATIVAIAIGPILAKPMEALPHYNVVMVHGASDSKNGFENECFDKNFPEAYEFLNYYIEDQYADADSPKHGFGGKLGDAPGMLGVYDQDGKDKLTFWLDSAIFEDYIYDADGKPFIGRGEHSLS